MPTLPEEKAKREHPESQEQRVLAAPLGGQSLERDASMIGAAQKTKGLHGRKYRVERGHGGLL